MSTVAGITGHTIQNNRIGVDIDNTEVGACGRGIIMTGDMKNTLVVSTTPSSTRGCPPFRSTTICTTSARCAATSSSRPTPGRPWPGNPKPEDAIQLGPLLPDGFEYFKPAKVTGITGTRRQGVSGDSSACPNCVIELFLDDNDAITEALQSLAVVTATADGSWSATLPFALAKNQGVRTTSTSAQFGTIPNISKGTTTGLSRLYGVKYHGVFAADQEVEGNK